MIAPEKKSVDEIGIAIFKDPQPVIDALENYLNCDVLECRHIYGLI